jgi:hypothetical protein
VLRAGRSMAGAAPVSGGQRFSPPQASRAPPLPDLIEIPPSPPGGSRSLAASWLRLPPGSCPALRAGEARRGGRGACADALGPGSANGALPGPARRPALRIPETPVPKGSPLDNRPARQARLRRRTGPPSANTALRGPAPRHGAYWLTARALEAKERACHRACIAGRGFVARLSPVSGGAPPSPARASAAPAPA